MNRMIIHLPRWLAMAWRCAARLAGFSQLRPALRRGLAFLLTCGVISLLISNPAAEVSAQEMQIGPMSPISSQELALSLAGNSLQVYTLGESSTDLGVNSIQPYDSGDYIQSLGANSQQPFIAICSERPGTIPASEQAWLGVPESSDQLSTRIPYVFLAGTLIQNGAVDARDCPDSGLLVNGAANACGMDRAAETVYFLQNLYDDELINAWEITGVPPAMLKQLFRHESQFWPGNFGGIHFGLGHLTAPGASTALFWNPGLYQDACRATYGQACTDPYVPTQNPAGEPLVRTVLDFVNAECADCELGIDIPKAEASVLVFAETVYSFCRQSSQIVYNLTEQEPSKVTNYVDIWKFTLFNYNVGAGCLYTAASSALESGETTLTWENIQPYIPDNYCQQGIEYVRRITAPFYHFSD